MVVAEAMASGLPVIVSGAAGASEWIEPGSNGLVIDDPTDAAGFARALREVQRDDV